MTEEEEMMVEEFLKAIRAPQPIEGLSKAENKLVRAIEAARGSIIVRDALAEVVTLDRADPPDPRIIDVMLCHIKKKRPDINSQIGRVWGVGFRWVAA